MGSGDLFKHLFKALNLDNYVSGQSDDARVQLTPLIALIASIIYMMIADGEVSDSESSQLQSVIGDNDEALHRALRYVESTPQEEFLKELPSVVFGNDKLCILLNVCDSIMSDGELSSLEWDLFQNFLAALGYSEKSFKPYFGAISIKNKRSVLGSFDDTFSPDTLTPQLSLAAGLLYMMSSDGVMAKEEIGQLQVIIGESKSLLKASLKYVGQNKAHQFLKVVPTLLSPRQKLCVLVNVCDTMLSDGLVENAERELFKRMLPAFGQTEDSFKAYYQIIFLKNEKPLDRRPVIKKTQAEVPTAIEKKDEEGVVFDRKFLVEAEKSSEEDFKKVDHSNKLKDGKSSLNKNSLESSISSKMRENAENLAKAIEDEQGLATIAVNANQENDADPNEASNSNSGPVINRKFKEENASQKAKKAKPLKSNGPILDNKINDDGSGPKLKSHLVDAENGPTTSNHITDSDNGPITENHINDSDNGPITKNRIDDSDDGPITKNRINDLDDGPKIKHHQNDDGITISGKHLRDEQASFDKSSLRDASGPIDFRKSKDAEFNDTQNRLSDSGPEIPRHQRDNDQSIFSDPNLGPNDGPIIRNEMVDDSGAVDGSPKKRMVFAKIQTEKIHGCLDQLEKYDFNKPNSKGVDLSSIAITPKPTAPKPKEVVAVMDTVPMNTEHSSAKKSTDLTTLPEPVMTKVEPVITKMEATSESVPLTSSRTRLMAGVMFTALSATHGISSMGESQAQIEMVNHGYQAVQVQTAFQSIAAQQVGYQLSANALDLSLDDTSKLTDEQKDIAESRLVLYRSTIQNQETSPSTLNGKKELAETVKKQDELAREASSRMNMFALSKSILLFGIGLSFMAFFSRSRWVLYGSAATAVIGIAITANGFFTLM